MRLALRRKCPADGADLSKFHEKIIRSFLPLTLSILTVLTEKRPAEQQHPLTVKLPQSVAGTETEMGENDGDIVGAAAVQSEID